MYESQGVQNVIWTPEVSELRQCIYYRRYVCICLGDVIRILDPTVFICCLGFGGVRTLLVYVSVSGVVRIQMSIYFIWVPGVFFRCYLGFRCLDIPAVSVFEVSKISFAPRVSDYRRCIRLHIILRLRGCMYYQSYIYVSASGGVVDTSYFSYTSRIRGCLNIIGRSVSAVFILFTFTSEVCEYYRYMYQSRESSEFYLYLGSA